MRFADAAKFFNKDPVYDAYTGALLFYCHTTAHDDHTSAGATMRRRTMTTTVDQVVPARQAVMLYGDPWLVGSSNPDSFQGIEVRRSWGMKRATDLMTLLTPVQAIKGLAGPTLYTQKEFFHDDPSPLSTSDWGTLWNIYLAPNEPVARGNFLRGADGAIYRVRNSYLAVDGLRIAEADQLDGDALQTAVFDIGTYDLITDKETTNTLALPAIQIDASKFYRFRTRDENNALAGDRVVFVAQADITPKVGQKLTMLGLTWRVQSVVPEDNAWTLRVRLAA